MRKLHRVVCHITGNYGALIVGLGHDAGMVRRMTTGQMGFPARIVNVQVGTHDDIYVCRLESGHGQLPHRNPCLEC